jgi:hypothetical protein
MSDNPRQVNGNGSNSEEKTPFLIGVSGGTASGKVSRRSEEKSNLTMLLAIVLINLAFVYGFMSLSAMIRLSIAFMLVM